MVIYVCKNCNYKTNKKYAYNKHINRKFPCKNEINKLRRKQGTHFDKFNCKDDKNFCNIVNSKCIVHFTLSGVKKIDCLLEKNPKDIYISDSRGPKQKFKCPECNIRNYTAKTKSNLNKHFKTKNHKLKELKEVINNSSKNNIVKVRQESGSKYLYINIIIL